MRERDAAEGSLKFNEPIVSHDGHPQPPPQIAWVARGETFFNDRRQKRN